MNLPFPYYVVSNLYYCIIISGGSAAEVHRKESKTLALGMVLLSPSLSGMGSVFLDSTRILKDTVDSFLEWF